MYGNKRTKLKNVTSNKEILHFNLNQDLKRISEQNNKFLNNSEIFEKLRIFRKLNHYKYNDFFEEYSSIRGKRYEVLNPVIVNFITQKALHHKKMERFYSDLLKNRSKFDLLSFSGILNIDENEVKSKPTVS